MLRKTTTLLSLLPLLVIAGCDRSTTEAEHGDPEQVQLRDHDSGQLYAFTSGTGSARTWNGTLPSLRVGESLEVEVRFLDHDGHTIPLGGEYSAGASLVSGSPAGILAIISHGDHLDIEGLAAGTVQVRISLNHGNHSDWDSPPLSVTVSP